MNRANALILIIAGAAAPGSVAYWHLPDMARLAAYAFVLALAYVVYNRLPINAPIEQERTEQPLVEPTNCLDYLPMSVVTTRLETPESYTGATVRLERNG
jgi:hypothetical protein